MATSVCGTYVHYAVNVRYIPCQSSSCRDATYGRALSIPHMSSIINIASKIWTLMDVSGILCDVE